MTHDQDLRPESIQPHRIISWLIHVNRYIGKSISEPSVPWTCGLPSSKDVWELPWLFERGHGGHGRHGWPNQSDSPAKAQMASDGSCQGWSHIHVRGCAAFEIETIDMYPSTSLWRISTITLCVTFTRSDTETPATTHFIILQEGPAHLHTRSEVGDLCHAWVRAVIAWQHETWHDYLHKE